MEALYILIPLSVVTIFAAIWAFLRMSDAGQFDDMVGPAMRILQDDDSVHEVVPAHEPPAEPGSKQAVRRAADD